MARLRETQLALDAARDDCEALARRQGGAGPTAGGPAPVPAMGLAGQRVGYLGGRGSAVARLRGIVEALGGEFSHHDAGLEERCGEALDQLLARADVVFCPVSCVSHDACLKAKRYCRRNAKRFVPLRSSGIRTFERALAGVTVQLQAT